MHFIKTKKILYFIIIIIFFMLPEYVFADVWENQVQIENITAKLPEIKSIKCKFRQEKLLPDIEKPILSSGDFEFIENNGVYFYTTYPVKYTVDYTNKNYKQINDIIRAISEKKYKKLEKEFNFYFQENKPNWIVGLKPDENQKTADFLYSILIEGSDYIQKIKIEMHNGSSTTLWFEK